MTSRRSADAGGARSDAELLAEHVAGSSRAFGQLVHRHQNRLWAVALRMMRDPDDAADVVQDALVKAFRRAETFRGDAAVSTWLHRIVVTTALDALRASHRDPVPDNDAAATLAEPRNSIADRQLSLDVNAALAALPSDQRAAVVLVDLAGFSVDDAAWALQCPAGTVKSRCFRGRARLASLLDAYGPAHRGDTGNHSPAADVPTEAATTRGAVDGERGEDEA